MSQKTYLIILKYGILAAFVCFFFVFKTLLFPFITSKQIPFNILIEVLFVIWLAFIIKYPAWNPFRSGEKKIKNLITYGLIAFFVVLTVSCFTGADFNLSFWGDVERMLGVFHLLHFLVFYFIIITVMRTWKDWRLLMIISLITATLVCFKALDKANPAHSTIGNTSYVSGMIIFNIFFAFILFFKETKFTGWRWLYFLSLPIMLYSFRRNDTIGAYIGLALSVLCFLFLYGVFNNRKKLRIVTLGALILAILLLVLVFANRDHPLVSKSRVIRQISLDKNTVQTRLVSWRAAGKDFKNHWLLGTGHGNYAITFDKYFDPKFYDFSRSETYFDRAHNNIIDIVSTTGTLGLLAYLSIFVGLGVYLVKAFRKERINLIEFSLISALVVAYFVQNLSVFDSFVTYVCLMVMLGYVHWLANSEDDIGNADELLGEGDRVLENKEISSLVVTGIIVLLIMYQYNILPLKMLTDVIQGQMFFGKGKLAEAIDIYDQAMSYETILDRDGRDILARSLIAQYPNLIKLDQQKALEIINFGTDIMERNIALNPKDSLMQMQLSRLYDLGFRVIKDKEKRIEYADKAMTAIEKSLEASPGRIPVYFIKSQLLVNQGKVNEAIEILEYATKLNQNYFETYCQLSQVYLIAGQNDKGFSAMDECLSNKKGASFIGLKIALEQSINHYAEIGDMEKLLLLYNRLISFDRNNPKIWINLAKLQVQAGDMEAAAAAARQAAKLDKNLEKDVEEFIRNLGLEEEEKEE